MAGSKRNKVKKMLSPPKALQPVQSPPDQVIEDEDLMDDLFTQLDSKDKDARQQSATILQDANISEVANDLENNGRKDSKSRFKARQARKAASLAEQFAPIDVDGDAKLEREAREEERIITSTCDELGLKMFEINPDGHCLFSAVADQLAVLGVVPAESATFALTRYSAAKYIRSHPDDFLPFLPSTAGEDAAGAGSSGLMSSAEFNEYCKNISDTAVWGGEPEIQALSRAYNVPIHVVQSATPHIVVHNPGPQPPPDGGPVLRISYHRRMYGLGEHYNSLRPKRTMADGIKSIFHSNSGSHSHLASPVSAV